MNTNITTRWIRILLVLCILFFLLIPLTGWMRHNFKVAIEKKRQDNERILLRAALSKAGDCISLEDFKTLFPNSYYLERYNAWAFKIPLRYDESTTCRSQAYELVRYNITDDGLIKMTSILLSSHEDRHNNPYIFYFKMAFDWTNPNE